MDARVARIVPLVFCILQLGITPRVQAGEPIRDAPRHQARYEGTVDLAGHYARPGDTHRYLSRQIFYADRAGNVRLDWTTWAEGDSAGAPESFLVRTDGRVFERGEPSRQWRELVGDKAASASLQARAGFPFLFESTAKDAGLAVSFDKGLVARVDALRAHPRLGDVHDVIVYRYGEDRGPNGFTMTLYERDHHWTLEAQLKGGDEAMPSDSLLAQPVTFDPAPPHAGELVGQPVFTAVAPGVWSADQEDVDSRSLVVEFADHLAVIEFAVGSANGERLVDAIAERWPTKPVRYALFSHHHPHYTGGLRAFIAAGATVITTRGNEAYVRGVAAYPFQSKPDRLTKSPRPLRIQTFEKRLELADATNKLVAIDIGERSDHTAEFVIFWLPGPKLVFEAEQGWVTTNGTLRAARRAAGFLQVLADEKVDVERLVQSWPMRGNRAEVTRVELEELVKARSRQ